MRTVSLSQRLISALCLPASVSNSLLTSLQKSTTMTATQNQNGTTTAKVLGVNGNIVRIELAGQRIMKNEVAYVCVGDERLKAEVLRINGNEADLQSSRRRMAFAMATGSNCPVNYCPFRSAPVCLERSTTDCKTRFENLQTWTDSFSSAAERSTRSIHPSHGISRQRFEPVTKSLLGRLSARSPKRTSRTKSWSPSTRPQF